MRAFTMHLHLVSLIVLSLYDYDNLDFGVLTPSFCSSTSVHPLVRVIGRTPCAVFTGAYCLTPP